MENKEDYVLPIGVKSKDLGKLEVLSKEGTLNKSRDEKYVVSREINSYLGIGIGDQNQEACCI